MKNYSTAPISVAADAGRDRMTLRKRLWIREGYMSIVFLTQNIALLMKKLMQVVEYFYATLYLSNFKGIIPLAAKSKNNWHLVEMESRETFSDSAHLL